MPLPFNVQDTFKPVNLGPFLNPTLSHDYQKAFAKYQEDQSFKKELGRVMYIGKDLDVSFFIGKKGQETMQEIKLVEMIARRDIRKLYGYETTAIDMLLSPHEEPPRLQESACYNPRPLADMS